MCGYVALFADVPTVTLQDLTLLVSLHKNTPKQRTPSKEVSLCPSKQSSIKLRWSGWSYREGTGRRAETEVAKRKRETPGQREGESERVIGTGIGFGGERSSCLGWIRTGVRLEG